MPIFSFTEEKDPIAFWKATYPDSDGIEALSILTTILETGFVHVDEGTPHEMYVWPYFVRMSLTALTPRKRAVTPLFCRVQLGNIRETASRNGRRFIVNAE